MHQALGSPRSKKRGPPVAGLGEERECRGEHGELCGEGADQLTVGLNLDLACIRAAKGRRLDRSAARMRHMRV